MMMRRKEQQSQQPLFTSTAGFGTEDKARISELTKQVDENNQQILLQKLEIKQLKDQIIKLLGGGNGDGSSMMMMSQVQMQQYMT